MTMPRYAANVDVNQAAIARELRAQGFSVELNHNDALVGRWGFTGWYEIKHPRHLLKNGKGFKKGTFKKSQLRLQKEFKGHYKIVTTAQEIIDDMKLLAGKKA